MEYDLTFVLDNTTTFCGLTLHEILKHIYVFLNDL